MGLVEGLVGGLISGLRGKLLPAMSSSQCYNLHLVSVMLAVCITLVSSGSGTLHSYTPVGDVTLLTLRFRRT